MAVSKLLTHTGRHPISYEYPHERKTRADVVCDLADDLEAAFRSILENVPARSALIDAPLELVFGSPDDRSTLGETLDLELEGMRLQENPPDYEEPRRRLMGDIHASALMPGFPNRDFYRDADKWLSIGTFTKPVVLQITNHGSRALSGVRAVLTFPTTLKEMPTDFVFCLPGDEPDVPQRREIVSVRRTLAEAMAHSNEAVTLTKTSDGDVITVNFGKLQAKQTEWSPSFRIGCHHQGEMPVEAKVYADEFSAPQEFALTVKATGACRRLDLKEFNDRFDRMSEQAE